MEEEFQNIKTNLNESKTSNGEERRYSPDPVCKPRSRAALSFMEVHSVVAASFGENERRCYKVHWKDSWIYEDHLFECEEIIEQFWKEQERNMKDIQKSSSPNEDTILRTSSKDEENVSKNSDMTVIVVSKDTESEMDVADEVDQNMTPDWLIGRGMHTGNMKENNLWRNADSNVKMRKTSNRDVLNIDGTTNDDAKENKEWENVELKCNMLPKKRHMFTCHICGDDFDMVSAIRRHYNTSHPGNKPFACESCGKRFDRKENLNRHIRIHTGDRRYVCNHCGKGYTDPSGLKKHVLSKHSNIIFSCQFCKATFKSKDSMNRHITKHLTELKGHKDDFNISSKRSMCNNTIESGKVVIQEGSNVSEMEIDNKNVTQSDLSENENSDSSNVPGDAKEEYPNPECIEVSFIHLSSEEKMSNDTGQFSNAAGENTHFVLPITPEQIIELASNSKAMPITTEEFIPTISNSSSEQLLPAPVPTPKTFTPVDNEKSSDGTSIIHSTVIFKNNAPVELAPNVLNELHDSKE